jgi:hypothetical protein
MDVFPKKFSSTKNIPDSDIKYTQKNQQAGHYTGDKPFSDPYEPQEDFDFLTLMNLKQRYPFSLNTKNIFPRDTLEDSK